MSAGTTLGVGVLAPPIIDVTSLKLPKPSKGAIRKAVLPIAAIAGAALGSLPLWFIWAAMSSPILGKIIFSGITILIFVLPLAGISAGIVEETFFKEKKSEPRGTADASSTRVSRPRRPGTTLLFAPTQRAGVLMTYAWNICRLQLSQEQINGWLEGYSITGDRLRELLQQFRMTLDEKDNAQRVTAFEGLLKSELSPATEKVKEEKPMPAPAPFKPLVKAGTTTPTGTPILDQQGNPLIFQAAATVNDIVTALQRNSISTVDKIEDILTVIQRYFKLIRIRAPDKTQDISSYQIEFRRDVKNYAFLEIPSDEKPKDEKPKIVIDAALLNLPNIQPQDLLPFLTFVLGHEGSHAPLQKPFVTGHAPALAGADEAKAQEIDLERFKHFSKAHKESVIRVLVQLNAEPEYTAKLRSLVDVEGPPRPDWDVGYEIMPDIRISPAAEVTGISSTIRSGSALEGTLEQRRMNLYMQISATNPVTCDLRTIQIYAVELRNLIASTGDSTITGAINIWNRLDLRNDEALERFLVEASALTNYDIFQMPVMLLMRYLHQNNDPAADERVVDRFERLLSIVNKRFSADSFSIELPTPGGVHAQRSVEELIAENNLIRELAETVATAVSSPLKIGAFDWPKLLGQRYSKKRIELLRKLLEDSQMSGPARNFPAIDWAVEGTEDGVKQALAILEKQERDISVILTRVGGNKISIQTIGADGRVGVVETDSNASNLLALLQGKSICLSGANGEAAVAVILPKLVELANEAPGALWTRIRAEELSAAGINNIVIDASNLTQEDYNRLPSEIAVGSRKIPVSLAGANGINEEDGKPRILRSTEPQAIAGELNVPIDNIDKIYFIISRGSAMETAAENIQAIHREIVDSELLRKILATLNATPAAQPILNEIDPLINSKRFSFV